MQPWVAQIGKVAFYDTLLQKNESSFCGFFNCTALVRLWNRPRLFRATQRLRPRRAGRRPRVVLRAQISGNSPKSQRCETVIAGARTNRTTDRHAHNWCAAGQPSRWHQWLMRSRARRNFFKPARVGSEAGHRRDARRSRAASVRPAAGDRRRLKIADAPVPLTRVAVTIDYPGN